MPDAIPINKETPNSISTSGSSFIMPLLIVFPESSLKSGINAVESIIAKTKLSEDINSDSAINWLVNAPLAAPIAFRTPTSRARSSERAVVRFTKLIQAMSRMKAAMMVNV
ncbi:hypothetical protein D3C87_1849780 [compost metagenome]